MDSARVQVCLSTSLSFREQEWLEEAEAMVFLKDIVVRLMAPAAMM